MNSEVEALPGGDPPGGLGGSHKQARDTRLVERAIREQWPIRDEIRGPLIERLADIALDAETSPREATSAAKALLSASKLNLESIAMIMKTEEREKLFKKLEEIEAKVEQSVESKKGGNAWA
jgi:hypothetical protein